MDCSSIVEPFRSFAAASRIGTPPRRIPKATKVEATNKAIMNGLKKMLDDVKGRWAEDLTFCGHTGQPLEGPRERPRSP